MKIVFTILFTLLVSQFNCTTEKSSAEYQPLIDAYLSFWNTGNFDGIDQVLPPDFELRMTPKFEPEKGIETFKQELIKLRTAYPDFHITVDESFFDTDKFAVRWTITGTNTGTGSHPPTGKAINVSGISIIHFQNGKIKDEWIASNNLYWLEQLGYKLESPFTENAQ
ncbi:MAG: ester cyclase [Calditrichota bacterium]